MMQVVHSVHADQREAFMSMQAIGFTCRNCVHADRSDWLNSYGTFQPIGPNLRLSCTMECRKHITNRSWRQSFLLTASSMSCKAINHDAQCCDRQQVISLSTHTMRTVCKSILR